LHTTLIENFTNIRSGGTKALPGRIARKNGKRLSATHCWKQQLT
jgi:hypothetical protein